MVRKIPETISEEEFLAIVKATKDKKKRLAFMLGFYQCLRVSEVINLIPSDNDKERGFLFIRQAKGQKDRHIPIMAPVKRGLGGLPMECSVRTLQRAIKRGGLEVLGKDIHFHTLRHSGATYYLNKKKLDIRHVQVLLGHSRLSTTEIYTHVTPEALKERFDEVWN